MESQYISVGRIVRAHGTAGEVVLAPTFDDPEVYTKSALFYLRNRHQYVPVRVSAVKPVRKGDRLSFFVKFDHIAGRTEAEQLRDSELFVPEDQIPQVEASLAETLYGFEVVAADGTRFGEVIDVLDNPAHPLLQIKDIDGAFFVPFVDAFIMEVDEDAQRIVTSDLTVFKSL
ncbi:MAG: 16S rRNA processing protein RimM [Bacteroidetes bacterium]|nr:16S rRNA processing protein RimM [Bacteroidota bacterium]